MYEPGQTDRIRSDILQRMKGEIDDVVALIARPISTARPRAAVPDAVTSSTAAVAGTTPILAEQSCGVDTGV